MGQSRTKRAATTALLDGEKDRRRRQRSLVAAAAVGVVVVGAAGWWANDIVHPTPVTHAVVTESFTARISDLDLTKRVGCVTKIGTRHKVCSNLLPLTQEMTLYLGERVEVAHEHLHVGGGNWYDAVLVYPLTYNPD